MATHAAHPSPAVDWLGQALSVVCLVHCAATPLVLALLPAATGVVAGWHPVLWGLVVVAAAVAFVPGYRHHRRRDVLLWAALGISLLALGAFWESALAWAEVVLSMAGASAMLYAHWRNRQLIACCAPGEHAHG